MNSIELLNDKKELNNVKDILKDTLQADPKALERLDSMNLDMNAIRLALSFLQNNPNLSDKEKNELTLNSWRIGYRSEPPSPEEFLTEKYLGPVATHTYDRIKKNFLEFTNPLSNKRNLILYPHIGYGKLSSYDSPVFTASGPVKMKDIKIGDKICNSYGGESTVLNKIDFPGEIIYKCTFNDGRSCLVGGNHNWLTHTTRNHLIYNKSTKNYDRDTIGAPCWKVLTTNQIIEDLEKHPKHRYKMPLAKPVYHKKRNHIISPYALGAYLGDGSYGKTSSAVVGDDYEIHERMQRENSSICHIKNLEEKKEQGKSTVKYSTVFNPKFRKEINRLGLAGCKSNAKFIPDEYLYDSIDNRIALLQGLMDTDGTVMNTGIKARNSNRMPCPSFWTSSKELAENIMTLIRGLGGLCRFHFSEKGKTNATKNYDAYIIYFNFPENRFPIFYLKRKQHWIDGVYNRNLDYRQKRKPQYLILKSIEKTNLKGGMCIEVDSEDHCYLTDEYIVTHNSYLSTMIALYFTLRMSLMRDPWKMFGLNPTSQICTFLCSYSLKKSSELLLDPFMSMLENSNMFQRVKTREKMAKAIEDYEHMENIDVIYYTTASDTADLVFTGGTSIKTISNPQGLLGNSCNGVIFSELSFFTLAGKSSDYIMELYNKGKQRVESRFHNAYGSFTILDSSPNSLDNAIDHYINFDASKDSSNMIVRGGMWETMPENYDFSKTFKVYIGGQGNPPKILEEGDPLLENSENNPKIIEIPESEKQFFKDDLINSLKDRAGIPSGSANSLIYDYDKIESIFNNGLRNMYEDIHAPAEMNPDGLIWNQIKDQFFKYRAGEYEFYYKPRIPRCVAVDQSYATDMMGISMGHVERYLDTGELIYVVDFTIAISPQKDSKSNLESIRRFIEDLKYKGHINIAAVGFDSFESQTTIQNLEREGFNVKKVSADKSMDPYLNMVALINSGRLAVGRNIFLKNNLKSLNVVGGGTGKGKTKKLKIDHDDSREVIKISSDHKWETSPLGMYSKDISDSMVDMIELCRAEFPIAEEQWWGPVKQEDFTGEKEKTNALNKLNNLFNKMGIK